MNFKLFVVAGLAGLVGAAASAESAEQVERGAYLVHIMDCGGCHNTGAFSPKPNLGTPLSGSGIGFEVPGLGFVYPPNLTPDQGDRPRQMDRYRDHRRLRHWREGQTGHLALIMP